MQESIKKPGIAVVDGKAGASITYYRFAADVFQYKSGFVGIFKKVLLALPAHFLMVHPVRADFVTQSLSAQYQMRIFLGNVCQKKETGFYIVSVQKLKEPVQAIFHPGWEFVPVGNLRTSPHTDDVVIVLYIDGEESGFCYLRIFVHFPFCVLKASAYIGIKKQLSFLTLSFSTAGICVKKFV